MLLSKRLAPVVFPSCASTVASATTAHDGEGHGDTIDEMLTAAGAEDINVVREPLPPGSSVHEIGTARMGDRSVDIGHRSFLPGIRCEERVSGRRQSVRLQWGAKHHLVDSGYGVAMTDYLKERMRAGAV